jgi:hypothetical protein
MVRAGIFEGHLGERDSLGGGSGGIFYDLGGGLEERLEVLIGVGTNANAIVTPVC